ncbi:hypothetical protein [Salibaculum griseiflavum]|uniref:hypothetical protein n=1 Tax=Salibaculum griseiflavum TaxID=1914409 RepID=UPI0011B21DEC|nr:hypothetical protein [Salibaculum griseiflavum]
MTQLASITNNHLALKCEMCGHQSMIAVQHLIARLGRDISVHQVVPKLRCAGSGAKGKATFVITYVGASGTAMLGARQSGSGD